MEMLYKDGEGTVYHNMLSWLDCKDTDLMTTAVLALGNFARKDSNCIQMVDRGLAKRLLGKLYDALPTFQFIHIFLSQIYYLSTILRMVTSNYSMLYSAH